jgi:hypothetical protein
MFHKTFYVHSSFGEKQRIWCTFLESEINVLFQEVESKLYLRAAEALLEGGGLSRGG